MVIAPMGCQPDDMTIAIETSTAAAHAVVASKSTFNWRPMVRPALALIIIVAAYRVSLEKLMASMRLDTPLAHLALVPFIALGLAAIARNNDSGPAIHDRQLDWIVGLLLSLAALGANVILPTRLSADFWVWRIDLLTLPMFVGGVITLLFGVRTLWKFRYAVGFLFLAWPYPYTLVLDRWLGRFTQLTISVLDLTLQRITIATKVPGSDSNFAVMHNLETITMSVASACSGANGMIGFVLVASAFLLVLDGSKKRKAAWLATGALLVWVLNVVRILIIFWAARKWGKTVAIDGFHPYVGLVVFNVAIIAMVILLKPFRLKVRYAAKSKDLLQPGPAPKTYRPQLPVALLCVSAMSLGVGVFNGQLENYDRIADSLGTPRLADFATSQETPTGWNLSTVATYPEYERFFGDNSLWTRYAYVSNGEPDAAFTANVPIIVDVVETPDRDALNAYGIEECYTFHGYSITGKQSVYLGQNLTGEMMSWTSSKTGYTYTQVYWHWPIKTSSGTEYERVTLVMNDQPTNEFTSPPLSTDGLKQLQLDLNDVLQGRGSDEDRARLLETRTFMIGFARNLVDMRAPAASAPAATTGS